MTSAAQRVHCTRPAPSAGQYAAGPVGHPRQQRAGSADLGEQRALHRVVQAVRRCHVGAAPRAAQLDDGPVPVAADLDAGGGAERAAQPGPAPGRPRGGPSTPGRRARRRARPPSASGAGCGRAPAASRRASGLVRSRRAISAGVRLLDVPGDERGAGVGRQQPQRPVQEVGQLVALEQVADRVVLTARRRPARSYLVAATAACWSRQRRQTCRAMASSQADAAAGSRSRSRIRQACDQRLLRQVLGRDRITGDGRADPDQPAPLGRRAPEAPSAPRSEAVVVVTTPDRSAAAPTNALPAASQ